MSDLGEIRQIVGKIDGKLDMVIENQKSQASSIKANEEKISSVSNRMYVFTGGMGVIAFIFGKFADLGKLF